MNNLAKAAIGVTGTGSACTGGYFICKECIFTSNDASQETPAQNQQFTSNRTWRSLASSNPNHQGETVGKIYGDALLDPYDEGNIDKWKELHQKVVDDENKANEQSGYTRLIISPQFQASTISNSFAPKEDSANSALNKQCQTYYDKEIEDKDGTDHSKVQIGGDEWKAIWMLCSEWNPKMLDANSYQDNTIGKAGGDELLSANGQDNEALWERKNQDFFGLKASPEDQIFKKLYEDYRDKENTSKLRDKCGELYNTAPSSEQEGMPNAEVVVKYCSMKTIHGS